MLSGLPAWTVRVGLPAHLAGLAQRMQEDARAQIATPLSDLIRNELRWYFERLVEGRSDHFAAPMSNDSNAPSGRSSLTTTTCSIEPGSTTASAR
jgi:hypothetical protein